MPEEKLNQNKGQILNNEETTEKLSLEELVNKLELAEKQLSLASKKIDLTNQRLNIPSSVISILSAIIGVMVAAFTPFGEFLKDRVQRSQLFSEKMYGAIETLSGDDERKAAMALVTLYPLAASEDEKRLLIKLALINNNQRVLEALQGIVTEDQVALAILEAQSGGSLISRMASLIEQADNSQYHAFQIEPGEEEQGVVSELQEILQKQGYYQGFLNGTFDSSTEEAVKQFQADQGLTPSGALDVQTLNKLNSLSGDYTSGYSYYPSYDYSSYDYGYYDYDGNSSLDYKDSYVETTRSDLLKLATTEQQSGWLYAGTYPMPMQTQSPVNFSDEIRSLLKEPVLQQDQDLNLRVTRDMYLREQLPQNGVLGQIIGAVSEGTLVKIKQAYIFPAPGEESRVWAEVEIEQLPSRRN